MWRATLKGLLAHKVRLGLTALAIVLGVGFVSGTYILTDTMGRAFDNLFSQIDKGIAVQVSGVQKFKGSGPGGEDVGSAERVPNSLLPQVESVPGVRAAAGELPAAKVRHWAKQLAPATVGPPRASFAEMAMAWRSAMALGALATAAPSAMGFGVGSAGPAEVPRAVATMGEQAPTGYPEEMSQAQARADSSRTRNPHSPAAS